MVRHVILWQLKDEISGSEKGIVKKGIKEGLEGLKGKIEGLVEIKVNENPLPSSNADVMLDSLFESADALKNGQIDAAFIVAGAPTTAVTDLATTKDVYLVSLDEEHINKLLETSDYYAKTVIAKDVYFGS